MLGLILIPALIYANEPEGFVKFPIDYPFNYSISVDEKTYVLFETPLSEEILLDFNAVAVHGKVSNPNVVFETWIPQFSQSPDDVIYHMVKPSAYKIYKNGRFWARFDLKSKVKRFKFVVINNGINDEKFDISIYEMHLIKSSKKKLETRLTDSFDPKTLSLPQHLPFKLVRRSDWGAKPPNGNYIPHTPKKITIHHTGGNYPLTYDDAVIEIEVIQEYHQEARGWIDIGYHFLIDPSGNIFEGRPILAVGAHVAGLNIDNIGISVMGNYHQPINNEVTQRSLSALITLVRYLKEQYGITKNSFYAHRDLAPTYCPGDNLYAKMPYLKNEIFKDDENSVVVNVDLGNDELNRKILESLSW